MLMGPGMAYQLFCWRNQEVMYKFADARRGRSPPAKLGAGELENVPLLAKAIKVGKSFIIRLSPHWKPPDASVEGDQIACATIGAW